MSINSPISDAARLLSGNSNEALAVVTAAAHRPTVVGFITDRDIVRAWVERGADLEAVKVLDILPDNPLVLNPEEELDMAVARLRAHGGRHAIVVGTGGTLYGTVSLADLIDGRSRYRGLM